MRQRLYFVYILASQSRRLYIGVTNDLLRRVWEHREKRVEGFSARYNITALVFFETATNVRGAIAREKELKGWRREKKIALIERENPAWHDLAATWFAKTPLSSRGASRRGILRADIVASSATMRFEKIPRRGAPRDDKGLVL